MEQIKGFNEAYKIVKKKGFENYFCLSNTTWKEASENIKKGLFLQEETHILILQGNVNIVLASSKEKKLPYCKTCKHLFSPQEFRAGFKECEHCAGHCGCKSVIKSLEVAS